jgi:hypothetical protein
MTKDTVRCADIGSPRSDPARSMVQFIANLGRAEFETVRAQGLQVGPLHDSSSLSRFARLSDLDLVVARQAVCACHEPLRNISNVFELTDTPDRLGRGPIGRTAGSASVGARVATAAGRG